MRKCINILQSVFLSLSWNFAESDSFQGQIAKIGHENQTTTKITVDQFYKIIGSISPLEIEMIFKILLSESFSHARNSYFIRN